MRVVCVYGTPGNDHGAQVKDKGAAPGYVCPLATQLAQEQSVYTACFARRAMQFPHRARSSESPTRLERRASTSVIEGVTYTPMRSVTAKERDHVAAEVREVPYV